MSSKNKTVEDRKKGLEGKNAKEAKGGDRDQGKARPVEVVSMKKGKYWIIVKVSGCGGVGGVPEWWVTGRRRLCSVVGKERHREEG